MQDFFHQQYDTNPFRGEQHWDVVSKKIQDELSIFCFNCVIENLRYTPCKKKNMTGWKTNPFEDVYTTENGDFPAIAALVFGRCRSSGQSHSPRTRMSKGSTLLVSFLSTTTDTFRPKKTWQTFNKEDQKWNRIFHGKISLYPNYHTKMLTLWSTNIKIIQPSRENIHKA